MVALQIHQCNAVVKIHRHKKVLTIPSDILKGPQLEVQNCLGIEEYAVRFLKI